MYYKKIYKKIDSIESKYEELKKDFKKLDILKSKKHNYIKEDKEELKKLWKKYIEFFDYLKYLIRKSSYRKYFILMDYNKLVLRKYLVNFYFSIILDLIKIFGKHEHFIRVFLDENFSKDYGYYSKFIYSPRYLNVLNTPKIFIEPFKIKIDKDIFELLNNLKEIDNNNRITADYNNAFFWVKYRLEKILFMLSKKVGYLISHTKFTTRKHGFISKENIDLYQKKISMSI